MRKFISFMVAATAIFGAVSCNKELPQDEQVPAGEKVVFTATVDGADTKAVLNENTLTSEWVANDAITIHNGTNGCTFTTTGSGASADFEYVGEFSGEKFMAVYPAGEYTADVANKTVNAYIPTYQGARVGSYNENAALAVAYTEDNTFAFKNAHALLKFTVKGSIKAIEFYGNNSEAITGNMLVSLNEDGTIKSVEGQNTIFEEGSENEWTGKGTWVKIYSEDEANNWCFTEDKTYYAVVSPADFTEGFSVNYILADDSMVEKAKTYGNSYTLKPNTILDLGELEYDPNKVDASEYGLVGSFQGWDLANSIDMEYVSEGWIVAKDIELYKTDEFKFVKGNTWDVSYGPESVTVVEGEPISVTTGGQNMKVSRNGKFDLYFHPGNSLVKAECVEEYTNLKVNVTIDNKANWSPLYITLKDGDTVIANNATVTNNTYAVSGDYIGSSLACVLSNGSKTFETTVSITKDGATVTLEETIIKLKVQLNTDNAKQWWGGTMMIHVWNTSTSLDTSWPGDAMTSESNYTWSIIVPSELVDKTINFLVHNGNGWQSSDSTVTIKAEGNTVTGSSIGIN